jgi:hypothetical protein
VDDETRDALDYVAIRRLLDAYGDAVNRRAWPELADLFRPDATVTIDKRDSDPVELHGPGAVGAFIDGAIARYDLFLFSVLHAHVALRAGGDADAATARVVIHEIRHDATAGARSDAYGLYRDRYVRKAGRWWLAGRRYASLARTGADLVVFPFPSDG